MVAQLLDKSCARDWCHLLYGAKQHHCYVYTLHVGQDVLLKLPKSEQYMGEFICPVQAIHH